MSAGFALQAALHANVETQPRAVEIWCSAHNCAMETGAGKLMCVDQRSLPMREMLSNK
jgi:hypothetical protein